MPKAQIHYFTLQDETRRLDKLEWLRNNPLKTIDFERIVPDEKGNWLNITDNDFEDLLPLASKDVKGNKQGVEFDKAVFKLFSLGVVTNRDEWVYDFNEKDLEKKVRFFCEFYEKEKIRWQESDKSMPMNDFVNRTIKWTEELENHLKRGHDLSFSSERVTTGLYKPFVKSFFYFDKIITHRIYQHDTIFGIERRNKNKVICFSISSRLPSFAVTASDNIPALGLYVEPTQCLPLYRYDENGNRIENITDWGLEQFKAHYDGMLRNTHFEITKQSIFHYVYGVLHNPAYRKKYEQNLKRDFPRIPFYEDFEKWASWGKTLMDLHIDYENAPLPPEGVCAVEHRAWVGEPAKRVEQSLMFNEVKEVEPLYKKSLIPKTKLKADKINGTIELDEKTIMKGIPAEAWEYKLGNRSALEWVLDQYKESKPSDPTILEKFNTYRFADYKEQVIDLLQRVCTVSVETMKIVNEMNVIFMR
jgi:predicted helicase